MAITKQKKVDILGKLKDQVGKSSTMVFVNFHGLPMATTTEMRKALTGQDVAIWSPRKLSFVALSMK